MGKKKPFIDKKNSVTFKLVERSQNDPLFVDETAPQYVLVEKKTKEEVLIDDDDQPSNRAKKTKLSKPKTKKEEQLKYGIYFDDDYDYLQHLVGVEEIPSIALEINSKMVPAGEAGGDIVVKDIDVADNVNQPSTSKPKLLLPSSVFESTVQEKVDLNKRAALPVGPQLDWDPDIIEAMEDDFDCEDPNNAIDDDFVMQAMNDADGDDFFGHEEEEGKYNYDFAYKHKKIESIKEIDDDEEEDGDNLSVCGYDGSDEGDYDDDDDYEEHHNNNKASGGRKRVDFDRLTSKTAGSHFTEYSITSSIMPRNDNLQTLDERFENFFIKEYADDTEMGALDCEDIAGEIDPSKSKAMQAMVDEYEEFKRGPPQYKPNEEAIEYVRKKFVDNLKLKTDKKKEEEGETSSEEDSDDDDDSEEEEFETIEIVDTARKGDTDRFDCESILSTMSNTMYQPTLLKETDRYGLPIAGRRKVAGHIQMNPKTGMPVGVFGAGDGQLNAQNLAALETRTAKTTLSRMSEISTRPKGETPEERAARKKELKELRAARRAEKKANRMAFKDEKLRQDKLEMAVAKLKKKVPIC